MVLNDVVLRAIVALIIITFAVEWAFKNQCIDQLQAVRRMLNAMTKPRDLVASLLSPIYKLSINAVS